MGTAGNSGGGVCFSEKVLPVSSPLHPVVDNQLHDHLTGTIWPVTYIFADLPFPAPVSLDPLFHSAALPAGVAGGTCPTLFLSEFGSRCCKPVGPPERRQRLLAGEVFDRF